MNKKQVILSVFILSLISILIIAGCQKTAEQKANSGTNPPQQSPHASGAINISQFPPLKDKSLVEQAIKNLSDMKGYKLVRHIIGMKDKKTADDSDFEITYIAPDQVYFFGDDNVAGKRQEIFQLGTTEYKSFDGKKWEKTTKEFPEYNFLPKAINQMFKEGTNFHLIGDNRNLEDQHPSCTVVIFERPSTVYKGQTEQIDFWIDNKIKQIVRVEILNDEKKPVGLYSEEFLRITDFNFANLKIELPPEAQAVK